MGSLTKEQRFERLVAEEQVRHNEYRFFEEWHREKGLEANVISKASEFENDSEFAIWLDTEDLTEVETKKSRLRDRQRDITRGEMAHQAECARVARESKDARVQEIRRQAVMAVRQIANPVVLNPAVRAFQMPVRSAAPTAAATATSDFVMQQSHEEIPVANGSHLPSQRPGWSYSSEDPVAEASGSRAPPRYTPDKSSLQRRSPWTATVAQSRQSTFLSDIENRRQSRRPELRDVSPGEIFRIGAELRNGRRAPEHPAVGTSSGEATANSALYRKRPSWGSSTTAATKGSSSSSSPIAIPEQQSPPHPTPPPKASRKDVGEPSWRSHAQLAPIAENKERAEQWTSKVEARYGPEMEALRRALYGVEYLFDHMDSSIVEDCRSVWMYCIAAWQARLLQLTRDKIGL